MTDIERRDSTAFITSDGKKFPTELGAQHHQQVLDALAHYDESLHLLTAAFEKTQQTKDNCLFRAGILTDYYYVVPGGHSAPHVVTVRFGYRNFSYDIESYQQTGDLTIEVFDEQRKQMHRYRLRELYGLRINAEKALAAEYESWAVYAGEEVERIKASIKEGKRLI